MAKREAAKPPEPALTVGPETLTELCATVGAEDTWARIEQQFADRVRLAEVRQRSAEVRATAGRLAALEWAAGGVRFLCITLGVVAVMGATLGVIALGQRASARGEAHWRQQCWECAQGNDLPCLQAVQDNAGSGETAAKDRKTLRFLYRQRTGRDLPEPRAEE